MSSAWPRVWRGASFLAISAAGTGGPSTVAWFCTCPFLDTDSKAVRVAPGKGTVADISGKSLRRQRRRLHWQSHVRELPVFQGRVAELLLAFKRPLKGAGYAFATLLHPAGMDVEDKIRQ